MKTIAVVTGTYNRLPMLKRAVASIRESVGDHLYKIIIVDGGSTDGTRPWLTQQPDIKTILQEGPLTGAVRAFNLGFGCAVDLGVDYVCHLNDDARLLPSHAIAQAIAILEEKPKVGEVAFEFNLRGPWGFEHVNGVTYANFGVIRTKAGIAVAKAQGDPTGRAWWNPIYRTYGADTEFGVWLWKFGWTIHEGRGLRVHDENAQDALRQQNTAGNTPKNGDSELFWSRWRNEVLPPPPAPVVGNAKVGNLTLANKTVAEQLTRVPPVTKTPPKLATWLVASHYRPKLLEACLLTLHDGIWPEGWTYEIVVGHHKHDLASAKVAKELGAIAVPTGGKSPGEKRNAALGRATGLLVLVTDDDDLQSPLRPGLAVKAYEAGWPLSGIREFRRLHLPEGHVVRWCGRGKDASVDMPPVYCGTARNYLRSLLVKHGGWRAMESLEDSDLHRRILRRKIAASRPRRELDLGDALADTTIILQHDTNIFSRATVPTGETAIIGKYFCRGEGHWSTVPNFPEKVVERLGTLLRPTRTELG